MDKDLESFTQDLMLLINAFITDTGEMKEVLARLSEQMDSLETDVAYMNKVVRDGQRSSTTNDSFRSFRGKD